MFSSHSVSFSDHITITPKDPQWVGAWWLGYLIAGSITLLAAVPFWCLPRTLPRPRSREDSSSSSEKSKFIMDDHTDYQTPPGEKAKIMEMARGKPNSLWLWSTFHISVEILDVIYKQYFSTSCVQKKKWETVQEAGLLMWHSGKEFVCQWRGCRTRQSSIPGSVSSPRGRNGNSLQYSCLGNSMDRACWATVH